MEYDINGLRVKKGDTLYFWQDNNLIAEKRGNSFIYYYYDESGVCGMNYNGNDYFFRKNILGDVLAVYDYQGTPLCRYQYDAWGNSQTYDTNGIPISSSSTHVGNINPFRYRGYYWDTDLLLYYLQSRYYDPALGRFISPDSIDYLNPESVFGLNLYAYCDNNPVVGYDPRGSFTFFNTTESFLSEYLIYGFSNPIWGRANYSITQSESNSNEPGLYYLYKNITNSVNTSIGIGFNLFGCIGSEIGISIGKDSLFNINSSANITPYFHYGMSIGVDGINFNIGITKDNVSRDLNFGIGLGPLITIIGIGSIVFSGGLAAPAVVEFLKLLFGAT